MCISNIIHIKKCLENSSIFPSHYLMRHHLHHGRARFIFIDPWGRTIRCSKDSNARSGGCSWSNGGLGFQGASQVSLTQPLKGPWNKSLQSLKLTKPDIPIEYGIPKSWKVKVSHWLSEWRMLAVTHTHTPHTQKLQMPLCYEGLCKGCIARKLPRFFPRGAKCMRKNDKGWYSQWCFIYTSLSKFPKCR